MDWTLFAVFCVLQVLNVVMSTIKSICTIKCNKVVASLVNAIYYGLYTVVLIFMTCELELWLKVVVVSLANLIGVFVVKVAEEKATKDKLWEVKATLPKTAPWQSIVAYLKSASIPHNWIDIDKYVIINCYCATKQDSAVVKEILDQHGAKYFVSESKTL